MNKKLLFVSFFAATIFVGCKSNEVEEVTEEVTTEEVVEEIVEEVVEEETVEENVPVEKTAKKPPSNEKTIEEVVVKSVEAAVDNAATAVDRKARQDETRVGKAVSKKAEEVENTEVRGRR